MLAFASAAMAQGYNGPLTEPSYVLNDLGKINIDNSEDRQTVLDNVRLNESLSETHYYEWQGYDGWFNNPSHPDWGGAGEHTNIYM